MVKTGFCSFAALFHANSNDWAKKALLLPDLEQRVRALIGIVLTNQQVHGRRSSAIRQQLCCCRSCIISQLSEYLLNNRWVLNAGNYHDETGTFATLVACSKDRNWPFPPIQSSRIVCYQIAALRHRADGRPAVSRIGTNGQKRAHAPVMPLNSLGWSVLRYIVHFESLD
jgi:hypothetical protein